MKLNLWFRCTCQNSWSIAILIMQSLRMVRAIPRSETRYDRLLPTRDVHSSRVMTLASYVNPSLKTCKCKLKLWRINFISWCIYSPTFSTIGLTISLTVEINHSNEIWPLHRYSFCFIQFPFIRRIVCKLSRPCPLHTLRIRRINHYQRSPRHNRDCLNVVFDTKLSFHFRAFICN